MPGRCYRWRIALLVGLSVATATCVQAAEQAEGKGDPPKLMIGDWYEVSTKRAGKSHGEGPIEGMLVKMTDDWIVLGIVVTCSDEVFRSPILNYFVDALEEETALLEDYPLIADLLKNGLLMKRVAVYSKSYYWIPRETA